VLDPGKWVLENRYQSLEMDMSILDVKNGYQIVKNRCSKTGAILALKNKCLMLENRYYTVENGCYILEMMKTGS
jgi:hypothetical protein